MLLRYLLFLTVHYRHIGLLKSYQGCLPQSQGEASENPLGGFGGGYCHSRKLVFPIRLMKYGMEKTLILEVENPSHQGFLIRNGQENQYLGVFIPVFGKLRVFQRKLEGGVDALCSLSTGRKVRTGQDIEFWIHLIARHVDHCSRQFNQPSTG